MNAEDITLEILSRAAKEGLPLQIGPDETLARIAIFAELIEANYLAGHVTLDEIGQPCNIGGARITANGREYFHELEKAQQEKKTSTKVKKSFRASAKWG